jgi:hypothetical protein
MIYLHYASSGTKCICFHGEEMPEGSPLRLVATFNDDEVAKAWAYLHRLSSPLSNEPIGGRAGHSGVIRARRRQEPAMLLSAEVRWFWEGRIPELTGWFGSGPFAPGGGEVRVDAYVVDPAQVELGVKSRGNKPGLELKVLVSERQSRGIGQLQSTTQVWTKVSSTVLGLNGLPAMATHKRRWLRKFDTGGPTVREIELGEDERPKAGGLPDDGCNVELTEVWLEDPARVWTTLGFEAFGSFDRLERSLAATLTQMSAVALPTIGAGEALSYPAWLAARAGSRTGA